MSHTIPTLQEFNSEHSSISFIILDPVLNEYWTDSGYTCDESEAKVFEGGFDSQEQVDAAYNQRCVLTTVNNPNN